MRSSLPQGRWLGLGHLLDQLAAVGLVERGAPGEQFVERQAKPIDIRAGVALAPEPFGGHVSDRPDDVAGVRQVVVGRRLGQAEVGDPDDPVGIKSKFDGLMSRCKIPCSWA